MPPGFRLRERLTWQTVGRLAITTLLLGGTLYLVALDGDYTHFTPSLLIGLIAGTYAVQGALAAITQGALAHPERLRTIAWAHTIWDLVLTTGLIYVSGGAGSVFTILYGVAILNAAIALGPKEALRSAVVALSTYVLVATCLAQGWLPHPPDQSPDHYSLSPSGLGYSLLSNAVGLLAVSLLAATLSARLNQAGGRALRAERQTAHLAQLNDDIVRSMAAGLITTDLAGTIRTVNPAGCAMLRCEHEALQGVPLGSHIPIDAQRSDAQRVELDASRQDGSTFPIGCTLTPLVGLDGARSGSLVVFQDLTEIRSLRAQAERAERLAVLGRLASGLAHEIRNPLGAISGSVQMVRTSTLLEQEDARLLTIVQEEVERLNELVTTMLDVGGRPTSPRPQRVDLTSLTTEVADMARSDTTLKKVTIDVPSDEPVHAEVDPRQLRQVVWNLLKNAIQASPPEASVTLSVWATQDTAVLEVRDQGAGIAAPDKERLFEMFYSGREQGIGLGLAVVKQIVDAHDARIEVEGAPGEGATFRIHIPRRRPTSGSREGDRVR